MHFNRSCLSLCLRSKNTSSGSIKLIRVNVRSITVCMTWTILLDMFPSKLTNKFQELPIMALVQFKKRSGIFLSTNMNVLQMNACNSFLLKVDFWYINGFVTLEYKLRFMLLMASYSFIQSMRTETIFSSAFIKRKLLYFEFTVCSMHSKNLNGR